MEDDELNKILAPNGFPKSEKDKEQFFELYKIMVASSESLVSRRQGVNTFFLTMNGLLLTAIGLFLRGGGLAKLESAGVLILAVAGAALCAAWRSLIRSFGQLNTGKFFVINLMEKFLAASIFTAEWAALEKGSNPKVYRSFTSREVHVPYAFGAIYLIVAVLAGLIAIGAWQPK